LLPLVVVAANGCVDGSSPTDVTHVDEPVQHTTIEGTAGLSSIDDALARIIPALDDPVAAAPLRAALLELRMLLASERAADGMATEGNATEATARLAVHAYGRSTTGEDADLDAIRLALDVATQRSSFRGPTR
jgi:hypothetical protein